jgi:hypothetical protein
MKKSKHPFLKWAGIVFLVLGLVYAGLVVAGNMAVRREKAALEAAGFPMRPEQVIPAAIPEKDNAAPLYNAAVKALKDVPFEGESVDGVTSSNLFDQLQRTAVAVRKDPDNGEVAKNFETLVRDPRVTDFLASVERGSALPGCRQENDYSMLAQRMAGQEQDAAKGPEMFLPYISDNLKVSQILAALALQQMRQGNTTAAWRTIEISFRFADTLRDEPLLISQLVRTTQQGIAIKAMKDAAAMSAPSEDVSQALQKQLSLIDGESTAALALNGERILFGEWTFSQSPASLGKFMRKMSPWWEVPFPYFSALTSVVFGPLLQPWENAAFLQASRAMLGGGDKAIPGNGSSLSLLRMPGLFAMTKAAVSGAQGLRMNLTHVDSAAVVARLGLAAINYKKEHGAFPRDLQALGAQDLVDPFTRKPLVYRPEPDGFLLYSLGPDLTDDGGLGYDYKEKKGDIVWRYEEGSGVSDATSG